MKIKQSSRTCSITSRESPCTFRPLTAPELRPLSKSNTRSGTSSRTLPTWRCPHFTPEAESTSPVISLNHTTTLRLPLQAPQWTSKEARDRSQQPAGPTSPHSTPTLNHRAVSEHFWSTTAVSLRSLRPELAILKPPESLCSPTNQLMPWLNQQP